VHIKLNLKTLRNIVLGILQQLYTGYLISYRVCVLNIFYLNLLIRAANIHRETYLAETYTRLATMSNQLAMVVYSDINVYIICKSIHIGSL